MALILRYGHLSNRDLADLYGLLFRETISYRTVGRLVKAAQGRGYLEADNIERTAKQRSSPRGRGQAWMRLRVEEDVALPFLAEHGLAPAAWVETEVLRARAETLLARHADIADGAASSPAGTDGQVDGMTTREQVLWNDIKSAYRTRILVELLDEAEGDVFDLENAEGVLHDVDALIEDVLGDD